MLAPAKYIDHSLCSGRQSILLNPRGHHYVTVQVSLPWHITNVPVPVQLGSPWPPVKVQVPETTPPLSVPVVVVVPLEVPVRFPVRARVLPAGVTDVTVKVSVPVTAFVELVTRVAEPDSVEPLTPSAKHAPALMKLKPVMFSGPLLVTENAVTKFSLLASAVPPINWASQFPLVDVLVVVLEVVLLPQPQTASSSASKTRSASFFMYRP